jgi:hypothetical protein
MKTIMKSTVNIFFVIAMLALSAVTMSSCDDSDDDTTTWQWPGLYTFNKAILQTQISISLAGVPVTVPAGTDITAQMAGGLLAAAPCSNSQNAVVELKSNNELFFSCRNESTAGLKAGTWEYKQTENSLNLNLASPPLAGALQLKIENVAINQTTNIVAGKINNFPLTRELLLGFIPPSFLATLSPAEIQALLASLPAVTLINMDIEFLKVQ